MLLGTSANRILNMRVSRWVSYALLVLAIGGAAVWITLQRRAGRMRATYSQLTTFSVMLHSFGLEHGGMMPGPAFDGAVEALMGSSETTSRLRGQPFEMILKNRDAWGRPFVYEWKQKGHLVIVRSVGANGRDDRGARDDLQIKIDMPARQNENNTENSKSSNDESILPVPGGN